MSSVQKVQHYDFKWSKNMPRINLGARHFVGVRGGGGKMVTKAANKDLQVADKQKMLIFQLKKLKN